MVQQVVITLFKIIVLAWGEGGANGTSSGANAGGSSVGYVGVLMFVLNLLGGFLGWR